MGKSNPKQNRNFDAVKIDKNQSPTTQSVLGERGSLRGRGDDFAIQVPLPTQEEKSFANQILESQKDSQALDSRNFDAVKINPNQTNNLLGRVGGVGEFEGERGATSQLKPPLSPHKKESVQRIEKINLAQKENQTQDSYKTSKSPQQVKSSTGQISESQKDSLFAESADSLISISQGITMSPTSQKGQEMEKTSKSTNIQVKSAKAPKLYKPLIASALATALGVSVAVANPTIQAGTKDQQGDVSNNLSGLTWDSTTANGFYVPQYTPTTPPSPPATPTIIENLKFTFSTTSSGVSGSATGTTYNTTINTATHPSFKITSDKALQIGAGTTSGNTKTYGEIKIVMLKNTHFTLDLGSVATGTSAFNGNLTFIANEKFAEIDKNNPNQTPSITDNSTITATFGKGIKGNLSIFRIRSKEGEALTNGGYYDQYRGNFIFKDGGIDGTLAVEAGQHNFTFTNGGINGGIRFGMFDAVTGKDSYLNLTFKGDNTKINGALKLGGASNLPPPKETVAIWNIQGKLTLTFEGNGVQIGDILSSEQYSQGDIDGFGDRRFNQEAITTLTFKGKNNAITKLMDNFKNGKNTVILENEADLRIGEVASLGGGFTKIKGQDSALTIGTASARNGGMVEIEARTLEVTEGVWSEKTQGGTGTLNITLLGKDRTKDKSTIGKLKDNQGNETENSITNDGSPVMLKVSKSHLTLSGKVIAWGGMPNTTNTIIIDNSTVIAKSGIEVSKGNGWSNLKNSILISNGGEFISEGDILQHNQPIDRYQNNFTLNSNASVTLKGSTNQITNFTTTGTNNTLTLESTAINNTITNLTLGAEATAESDTKNGTLTLNNTNALNITTLKVENGVEGTLNLLQNAGNITITGINLTGGTLTLNNEKSPLSTTLTTSGTSTLKINKGDLTITTNPITATNGVSNTFEVGDGTNNTTLTLSSGFNTDGGTNAFVINAKGTLNLGSSTQLEQGLTTTNGTTSFTFNEGADTSILGGAGGSKTITAGNNGKNIINTAANLNLGAITANAGTNEIILRGIAANNGTKMTIGAISGNGTNNFTLDSSLGGKTNLTLNDAGSNTIINLTALGGNTTDTNTLTINAGANGTNTIQSLTLGAAATNRTDGKNGTLNLSTANTLAIDHLNVAHRNGTLDIDSASQGVVTIGTAILDGGKTLTLNNASTAQTSLAITTFSTTGENNTLNLANAPSTTSITNFNINGSELSINNEATSNPLAITAFNGTGTSTLNLDKGGVTINDKITASNGVSNTFNIESGATLTLTDGFSTNGGGENKFFVKDKGTLTLGNLTGANKKLTTTGAGSVNHFDIAANANVANFYDEFEATNGGINRLFYAQDLELASITANGDKAYNEIHLIRKVTDDERPTDHTLTLTGDITATSTGKAEGSGNEVDAKVISMANSSIIANNGVNQIGIFSELTVGTLDAQQAGLNEIRVSNSGTTITLKSMKAQSAGENRITVPEDNGTLTLQGDGSATPIAMSASGAGSKNYIHFRGTTLNITGNITADQGGVNELDINALSLTGDISAMGNNSQNIISLGAGSSSVSGNITENGGQNLFTLDSTDGATSLTLKSATNQINSLTAIGNANTLTLEHTMATNKISTLTLGTTTGTATDSTLNLSTANALTIDSLNVTHQNGTLNIAQDSKGAVTIGTATLDGKTLTISNVGANAVSPRSNFNLLTINKITSTDSNSSLTFETYVNPNADQTTTTLGGMRSGVNGSSTYGYAYSDRVIIKNRDNISESPKGTYQMKIFGEKDTLKYTEGKGTETKGNIAVATIAKKGNVTSGTPLDQQGIIKLEAVGSAKGFRVVEAKDVKFATVETDEYGKVSARGGGGYITYFVRDIQDQSNNAVKVLMPSLTLSSVELFLANFNSLNKRMGDLRDNPYSQGVWARVFNGLQNNKLFDGINSSTNYTSIQAGYDHGTDLNGRAKNYLGFAFSFSFSSSDFKGQLYHQADGGAVIGNSKISIENFDSKLFEVAFYNAYIADQGWYNDTIAKFSYILNDLNIGVAGENGKSKINTYALMLSNELGYRFKVGSNQEWFIDPQIEVGAGYIKGNSLDITNRLNGSSLLAFNFDALWNVRGRVGTSFGYDFKNFSQKQDVDAKLYLGVFGEFDYFKGGTTSFKTKPRTPAERGNNIPDFDARVVLNAGTNIAIKEATRIYFDFETSFVGKITTDYKINAGVRYAFGEKRQLLEGNKTAKERKDINQTPLKLEEKKEAKQTQEVSEAQKLEKKKDINQTPKTKKKAKAKKPTKKKVTKKQTKKVAKKQSTKKAQTKGAKAKKPTQTKKAKAQSNAKTKQAKNSAQSGDKKDNWGWW